MNFIYFKYFCDAVKLGSITESAKANFVTQSAVSQGIKKLEHSLGCSLLAGHPNQFRLTPEGQLAFAQMSDILKRTIEFSENFAKTYENTIGDLEFACTFSLALTTIPRYIEQFRLKHPQSKINLQCSANPEEIKKKLQIGELDFALLMDIGDISGFQKEPVYEGAFNLYVSNEIDQEKENQLDFILTDAEDAAIFKQIYSQKHQKAPPVSIEARSWIMGAELVSCGLGIGYFPDYILHKKNLNLRPFNSNLTFPKYKIYALYSKGMKLRKSSEIFLSYFAHPETLKNKLRQTI